MNPLSHLPSVRQAIIRANPEIRIGNYPLDNGEFDETFRPIRLADVLLAAQKREIRLACSSHGGLLWIATGGDEWEWAKPSDEKFYWNLLRDSLDD